MNTHPEAELSIEPEETCKWGVDSRGYIKRVKTACGAKDFSVGVFEETQPMMKFCPYCGKKIEEVK
jgi:hypothetical protein